MSDACLHRCQSLLALAFFGVLFLLYAGCTTPESTLKSIEAQSQSEAVQLAEFERFAQDYPNSPESVYALFRRGEIFQKQKRWSEAKAEYRRAIERNRSLAQKNPRYALMALYHLSDLQYFDYRAMQPAFVIPPSAFEPTQSPERLSYAPITNEKLQLKQTLGKQLVEILNEFRQQGARIDEYLQVALAACYLSEDFGNGFMRLADSLQTLCDSAGRPLHPNKRILAAYQAHTDAAMQFEIAAKDYKALWEQLLDARRDSAISPGVREYIIPFVEQVAEKVIEMRYKAGYAHEKNALLTLGAEPDESQRTATVKLPIEQLDLPIGEVVALLYLFQVVERFVRPSIEQAVKAYQQGLKEAAEMNVATTNYAAMSEQGLLELGQKAALRVDSLATVSFALLDELDQSYQMRISTLGVATPADTLMLFLQFKKMERLIKACRSMLLSTLLEHDKAYAALRAAGLSETALAPVKERAQLLASELWNALTARRDKLLQSIRTFEQALRKDRRKIWYASAGFHYRNLLTEWQHALNDFQESRARLAVMK